MANITRLTELLELIRAVDPAKLDLSEWRERIVGEQPVYPGAISDKDLINDCGTIACAVGWACAHPPFKEQGLLYDSMFGFPVLHTQSGVLDGWEAVEEFFSISHKEARTLFMYDKDEDGNEVKGVVPDHQLVIDRLE